MGGGGEEGGEAVVNLGMLECIGVPIKAWSEDDRPREKMISKGRHVLSDVELLATIIRSGTRNESAVELARRILRVAGNLNALAMYSINDFQRIKGIGPAKASSIMAALELGKRRYNSSESRYKVTSSQSAFEYMRGYFCDLIHEEFWVLLLNKANFIIAKQLISRGGLDSTVVDPKLIFRAALENSATGIILCHNHPSRNPIPSPADIHLTGKMLEAARFLQITLLDHLIFAEPQFYSFADNGKL